jgi:hypothetical protein
VSDTVVGLIGFGIVLISAVLLVVFSFLHRKSTPVFRDIPAFTRMRHAVGRVVEDGTRLHVSLGRGSLVTPQSASGLAGLLLLRRLAELTSAGDNPPIAAERENTFTLAGSDNLTAQAVLYASAQEPLIGEELFASGAYTEAGGLHNSSLTMQDILRWSIVAIILIGGFLTLIGVM